jgi:uncharacterized repeat protein (TIGR03803 family)
LLAAVSLVILAGLVGSSRPAIAAPGIEIVKSFEQPARGLSALVLGSDGALYGTTGGGGSYGDGTIFKIDSAGTFTSLYSFYRPDGSGPSTDLVLGSDGALYGSTQSFQFGRDRYPATLFKIDSAGTFTSLHSFDDGWSPESALVRGSDGALYGTTSRGGPAGGGLVYRVPEPGQGLQLGVGAAALMLLARPRRRSQPGHLPSFERT